MTRLRCFILCAASKHSWLFTSLVSLVFSLGISIRICFTSIVYTGWWGVVSISFRICFPGLLMALVVQSVLAYRGLLRPLTACTFWCLTVLKSDQVVDSAARNNIVLLSPLGPWYFHLLQILPWWVSGMPWGIFSSLCSTCHVVMILPSLRGLRLYWIQSISSFCDWFLKPWL